MTRVSPTFTIAALLALTITAALTALPEARADSLGSRCGYSQGAETATVNYQPCVFSQRQGYITISMNGEAQHQFSPDGDLPGTYLNQAGERVYRKKGPGESGQLFQLPGSYIHVLWSPAPSRIVCPREDLTAPNQCLLGDGKVGFTLQATAGSSLNTLTLTPIGLERDNQPQSLELDGTAYLAELADLDSNGWPEVYVYVSSAGSGSYGSLVAYAVNEGKSASPIFLPPLQPDSREGKGYQGHDEFRVVENRLMRRYPVYLDTDTNAKPSGGKRQVQYKLVAGEAGWQLEIER